MIPRALAAASRFWASAVIAAFFAACSLPSLEVPECTAARGVAKEFYSYHFGNEMAFSEETLRTRERFLTGAFIERLRFAVPGTDPFTTDSADIPKAFRIGGCEKLSDSSVKIEVLLFWRDEQRSEERRIHVEVSKHESNWLINKILF